MRFFSGLLVLMLFVSLGAYSQSKQTLIYKVLWKGDSIGFVKAHKQVQNNEKTTYDLHTNTTFDLFLGKISLDYYYSLEYFGDQLLMAKTDGYLNNKERSKAMVKHSGNGYNMEIDGKDEFLQSSGEDMTISAMYFQEPTNFNQVFCERLGKYCSLDAIGNSAYVFNRPNGRSNTYFYENDLCVKAEMNYRFVTIYIELVDVITDHDNTGALSIQHSSF